jgi:hypothetical protein
MARDCAKRELSGAPAGRLAFRAMTHVPHARRASAALPILLLLLSSPAPAAPAPKPTVSVGETPLEDCEGDPIAADTIVELTVPGTLRGSFLMVPFEVPAGTTSVRVKYCWEGKGDGDTIDLGLWQARTKNKAWGVPEFRGWGGSSHPDVTVTPQGFSTEEQYLMAPKGHVAGRTTRGFVPGPIPAGTWAVELGIAAIVEPPDNPDDAVDVRVEIELRDEAGLAAEPYVPAPYDTTPANSTPGWYAGDMHVHAEHSALGNATMTETFDYAFRSREEDGAGLDFITLSDYVTPSAWDEIGRYQGAHLGKLIIRSSEVITYRGHTNNHASLRYVDHRTGPVYELLDGGTLRVLRKDRDPKTIFKEVHKAGGWTQLNHPTTCPSSVLYCLLTCRGCPWDYTTKETKPPQVDAIEVHNGVGSFTRTAIDFWDALLASGQRVTAVASSDSHEAGGGNAPIGIGTTVVYAQELSEHGVRDAVLDGHAYIKTAGPGSPDLRFEGRVVGSAAPPVIMGDDIKGKQIELDAEVSGIDDEAAPYTLVLVKDNAPVETIEVAAPGATHTFTATGPGRYRLEFYADEVLLSMTNPIYVRGH